MRIIRSIEQRYLLPSLDMAQQVFTQWSNPEEGLLVRSLIAEIRDMDTYLPELELIMVDENDTILGYVMFSRFTLQGSNFDKLLLLSPVAVKTELQRQHISKELIEFGFQKAAEMGYTAVLVEGNPQNYRSRGFVTSADFGIVAAPQVQLPAPECLMVRELVPGALDGIAGTVSYDNYKSLT